jgi:3-oxoacyl-[acyl-carrier protein] reductase
MEGGRNDLRLKNKVALVTGSGRGIGRAIAMKMASEGASLVINALHPENSDAVKKEIESNGGKAVSVSCDISKQEDVDRLFESVKRDFGTLDILVNNAGLNIVKPATEMTEGDWDAVLSVNLKSIFLCSKAAAGFMMPKNYGRMINIASIVGLTPFPNRAPYAASKAAVIMLTRELAIEWAKHNIMVNAIAPGFFLTDMLKDRIKEGAISDKAILRRVPMGRFGLVEEIGNLAMYLCSDESSYITGQCITIDGGYTAYGFVE